MIIPQMLIRLKHFVQQLADEPETSLDDPALMTFVMGRSIAETTSALGPGLAGPALVIGQRTVEQDIRNLILGQTQQIVEQQETIDEQQEIITALRKEIHMLELRIEQMRRQQAASAKGA